MKRKDDLIKVKELLGDLTVVANDLQNAALGTQVDEEIEAAINWSAMIDAATRTIGLIEEEERREAGEEVGTIINW